MLIQQQPGSQTGVEEPAKPSDIAIIGMACLLPNAPTLRQYWENILNKINAIEEIPSDRWDWRSYYSEDRTDADKIYSKWGAFIDPIAFDPIQYGMPPNSLSSIEPLQLLTLKVASEALKDAGYHQRPFQKERTAVILGISGVADLAQSYSVRSALPLYMDEFSETNVPHIRDKLPQWTEDSFPGILPNVAAGRIANRLDMGGANFVVDGACASSLAAVYTAVKELETGAADMVLVGGADAMQNPFTYLCFSNTQALSPRGQCRPLDESADGIVIGEGIGVAVLKRLTDAQRDGDNIYAVIKGVGAASDGRDKSLTAPRPQGQLMALKRAYRKSNVSPATVGLIEAHATGTTVGDKAEIEAMSRLFIDSGAGKHTCAIGSVKSMIGHTKSTAGIASLMKAALSLHHKTLPPTLGVKNPNSALQDPESPLYANTQSRPWISEHAEHPRRAGVSAFGFGGTNFHVVLQENEDDYLDHLKTSSVQTWPGELLVFRAPSHNELLKDISILKEALDSGSEPSLAELAFAFARKADGTKSGGKAALPTLAIVAASLTELSQKIVHFQQLIQDDVADLTDPRGIYFSETQPLAAGQVAFVFPGQGSQYVNMLADLAIHFSEVRTRFERSNLILKDKLPAVLSSYVFPKPAFGDQESLHQKQALAQTRIAQPAMGTANLAIFNLLKFLGLCPDMVAGHSYGEYVALCAAGVLSESDLILLSEARARFMARAAQSDPGAMAAVQADASRVEKMIGDLDGIWIANINAPEQTVVSGKKTAIEKAVEIFSAEGIHSRELPVSCAFHSPLIAPARERFAEYLAGIKMNSPQLKVYSNLTAAAYPSKPSLIRNQLAEHLVNRVEFVREIEAMYGDGARVFVEVGAGSVLKGLTDKILGDRPRLVLNANQAGRHDVVQLLHLIGQLAVNGVSIKLPKLFELRSIREIDLDKLLEARPAEKLPPTTWWVNGARAVPADRIVDTHSQGNLQSDQSNAVEEMNFRPTANRANKPHGGITEPPELPDDFSAASGQFEQQQMNPVSLGREIGQVLTQHQRLMQKFIETQKSVMLDYLNRMSGSGANVDFKTAGITAQLQNELQSVPQMEPPPSRPVDALTDNQSIDSPKGSGAFAAQPAEDFSGPENLPDRETLTSRLLEIVSERTGYPVDVLKPDLDLEAELGIDSIKRVEILGHYLEFAFGTERENFGTKLDDFNNFRTLDQVISYTKTLQKSIPIRPPEKKAASVVKPSQPPPASAKASQLPPRFTLAALDAPAGKPSFRPAHDRAILITDDGSGVAKALKRKLVHSGYRASVLHFGEAMQGDKYKYFSLNKDFEKAISDPFETIRQRYGQLGGIIHLLPLRPWVPFDEIDIATWRERLQLDVKTLFYLLQLAEDDLKRAAEESAGFVLCATGMGGNFACDVNTDQNDFFPGNGAIAGLLKTVALEWPEVYMKVVDLCPGESTSVLASHLMAEVHTKDNLVEVGYHNSRRLTLGLVETPLDDRIEDTMQMDSSWNILITGGARGITAEVAKALAHQYRPTIILAGRSPLPLEKESDATARFDHPKEIKAALISAMKHSGEPVNLAKVEAEYKKLLKQREIRRNLAQMKQTGARVEYRQVDVRNEKSFGQLIDQLYRQYDHIDGVIHGAGIIEDKLFTEKSWESFERVFGTKTDSAFILSRKLRPKTLKFLVIFSSVAGRFGNRGQSDYTAANEVLNKIAEYLNRRWTGRIISPNWGPWQGPGMVSLEVQQQFAERGVSLISSPAGGEALNLEIQKGRKNEVEVLIGDGPWADNQEGLYMP
jgi:acyl transferase domain-containing protein/NAD(P)-dependent dehydrogenase (short-subunit alcohol dehydrogenase family)